MTASDTSVEDISFERALVDTAGSTRHVLLGNADPLGDLAPRNTVGADRHDPSTAHVPSGAERFASGPPATCAGSHSTEGHACLD